ncbi:unnamed protein product [Camellia sinensis]
MVIAVRKRICVRSAEVANKQHLEGVKKIAKLEAECQRLRGLVRKKLPGPAALAQMKLEVENLGRGYGETRVRRSLLKPPSPHPPQLPDFSLDSVPKFYKESDFLTERLLAMEEETKMLKKALAMCTSELQASRNICAKTVSKLQILESQLHANNQQKKVHQNLVFRSPLKVLSVKMPSVHQASPPCLKIEMTMKEVVLVVGLQQRSLSSPISRERTSRNLTRLKMKITWSLWMTSWRWRNCETQDSLHHHTMGCVFMESHCSDATCDRQVCFEGTEVTEEKEMSLIHDFVLVMGNEATAVQGTSPDGDVLSQKIQKFSAAFDKVINSKISLLDFVLDLCCVLIKAGELHFNVLGYKNNEAETNCSYCIDKVALPENKVVRDTSGDRYSNGCAHFSDSTSDPDIPNEGSFISTFESNATSWKCSLEEFEQLKLEKDNMVLDLESTKAQLQGTVQLLAEVKSQLASAQKLNSLAETQLKCMAKSYKSPETRAEELQTEVNLLRAKTENLDNELQEERRNHQDALAKFKDFSS